MLKVTQLPGKIVFMMFAKLFIAAKKCLQAPWNRISIISDSAQVNAITVGFGKSGVSYRRRAKSYHRYTVFINTHTYQALRQ